MGTRESQLPLLGRVRWKWTGWRAERWPGEHSTGWMPWADARIYFGSLASRPDVGELRRDRLGAP